jgi:hypothetical protein
VQGVGEVYFKMAENEDDDFIVMGVCETQVAMKFKNGTFQCRKGPKSKFQEISSLKRNYSGLFCDIELQDDPDNYKIIKYSSVISQCGFNKEPSAYCEVQLGDDYVINAVRKARSKYFRSIKNCHPLSNFDQNKVPLCQEVLKNFASNEVFIAIKRIKDAHNKTYHLTANNDKCVAISITQKFWMGKFDTNFTH